LRKTEQEQGNALNNIYLYAVLYSTALGPVKHWALLRQRSKALR